MVYIKFNKWNLIIIFTLIYQIKQVKTDKESIFYDDPELKPAKQRRDEIMNEFNEVVDFLNNLDDSVFYEVVTITGNDKLNRSNYHIYMEQLRSFENNVSDITLELQESFTSDRIDDFRNKSIYLIDEVEQLKKDFDEDTVKGFKYLNYYFANETIMSRYDNLTNNVNELTENINDITCMYAIELKNFKLAELYLNNITNDNRISDVIQKTYSGSSKNYYKIIILAETVTNLTRSYFLYNELYNLVKQEKFGLTIDRLEIMIKSLTKKIINNKQHDYEIVREAKNMINLLKTDIKAIGVTNLADIFEIDITLSELTDIKKVFSIDRELAFDMFNEFYQVTNNKKNLIKKIQEIFETLMIGHIEDSEELFNYIIFIDEFFSKIDQNKLIDESLQIIKNEKNVSESIKSILFSEKVCISNEANKNLSAQHINSTDYGVVIRRKAGLKNKDFWVLHRTYFDTYKINNYDLGNYFIALVRGHEVNLQIEGEEEISNLWKLEPTNDYVLIKNSKNNEYLFSTENKIFTAEFKNTSEYQWRIKDC